MEVGQQRRDRLDLERRDDHRDPTGALDRAQVGEPEGHLAPRWLAMRSERDLVGEADLGRGDADQRTRA